VGAALRLAVNRGDAAHFLLGAFLLLLTLAASTRVGEVLSVTLLVALAVFGLVVVAFVALPHVALATMIPLFVFLPMVKALYVPWIGPLKDVVTLAALAAAGVTVLQAARGGRRIPGDVWIVALCAFLLGLYALNVGGGLERTWGWAHGVRLFALPLSLLLVGMTLKHPRRTLRWAMTSVVATAVVVALVGIAQQLAGPSRLVEMGWLWNVNIRTIGGFLRSFGTLDEPFAYAAVLVFGLVGTLMWAPRRPLTFAAAGVIVVGLSLSVVRSAGLIALGLLALLLARHGKTVSAVFLLAVVLVASATFILSEDATERRVVQGGPALFYTLNGRTTAWKAVFEDAEEIPMGRGVGEVGTAANRASFSVTRTRQEALEGGRALVVDSGYFAVVADIGIVGLAGLFILIARLGLLAQQAVKRGRPEGWVALGLIASLVLDAVTRESFTAFPTAYLGMLLIGLALAAANDRPEDDPAGARVRRRRRRAHGPRPAPGLPRPGTAGA
jgi:O-antigen ligase